MQRNIKLALFVSMSLVAQGVRAASGLADVSQIERRGDQFKITCLDGTTQIATEHQILQNFVCGGEQPIFGFSKLVANTDGTDTLYAPWALVDGVKRRLVNIPPDGFCKFAGYSTATSFFEFNEKVPDGTPVVDFDPFGHIRKVYEHFWPAGSEGTVESFVTCVK